MSRLGPPPLLESREQESRIFETRVRELAANRNGDALEILEAGCGRCWPIDLSGVTFRLTGIDEDKASLDIRKNEVGDLDEPILGDLRTAELPSNRYDVVFNSFVLEHIDGAEHVLENFVRWAKPGGLLLLRFPDRDSVFGFLTRITPFWFHVFYKRWIVGQKTAGQPGFGPFPTHYDRVVSRRGMRTFCDRHGLIVREEWVFPLETQGFGWKAPFIRALVGTVGALSFGRLSPGHNWLTYVLEKPHPGPGRTK
ncbi:MAG: class I SAM-dependent methyltransferase [Gemmatimonadetes bacterium]|nr:class I SAM-dependent methyltransferase [Gemmatimonadota bacterium]